MIKSPTICELFIFSFHLELAARPYQFIKFDPYLQRKQREFVDPSSKQNTSKLNSDLADIHSIMTKNIQEVLNRGEVLGE